MTAMQEFVVPKSMPNTFVIKIVCVKLFWIKLLLVIMQFQCRRAKILNNLENKGEFGDFKQITRMKNCAIRDFVAQLKMKWRCF
jgi:hypothetical protein